MTVNNEVQIRKEQALESGMPKSMADRVLNSVVNFEETGSLVLPKNYVAGNALKTGWLMMQEIKNKNNQLAIHTCSKESIANTLLQMVILGLNPAKKQCYFIPYGDQMQLFVSYFGQISALKRVEGYDSINAQVIYEGDEFTYDIDEMGVIHNVVHKQNFMNIDDTKIAGGYCVIKYKGKEYVQVRNLSQIKEAWRKSKGAKDKTEFRGEFVKRTMINTSVKWFNNTTSDDNLIIDTLGEVTNNEFDFSEEQKEERVVIKQDEANIRPSSLDDL